MKNVNNDLNPERFNELLFDVGLGPPFSWNPIGLNNASWKYATAPKSLPIGEILIYLILEKLSFLLPILF